MIPPLAYSNSVSGGGFNPSPESVTRALIGKCRALQPLRWWRLVSVSKPLIFSLRLISLLPTSSFSEHRLLSRRAELFSSLLPIYSPSVFIAGLACITARYVRNLGSCSLTKHRSVRGEWKSKISRLSRLIRASRGRFQSYQTSVEECVLKSKLDFTDVQITKSVASVALFLLAAS